MFAIIQTGGKQYKVEVGQSIDIEKLECQVGDKLKFDVLLISDGDKIRTGTPTLKDAVCEAEVVAQGKADKIIVYKYKAKKNERKKQGHRQPFTRVKIVSIK
ncbi:MAG: 50S ribosomal protein L21 [Christensenellaceae bacterium]|jgi:large subunit ribosomal protein L21|nr:50S ribosomal protein L21 [Christensenellaceae bacterium]